MKLLNFFHAGILVLTLISAPQIGHANVYATDIKLNGSLSTITNAGSSPVTITYRLNQIADLGVTLAIFSGASNVATLNGGTNRGLNTVVWGGTNNSGSAVSPGAYSLRITAAALGFTNWTQISIDSNSGMPAFFPLGIDVDKNTNSRYYGRIIMSCATHDGAATNVPAAAQMTGLYKMNADGSQADEGWYGNANYLQDDNGDTPVPRQMPDSRGFNPMKIRIGDDDRIYWVDDSYHGAIIACDMLATTNQIVVNEAGYSQSPEYGDLTYGFEEFDVAGTTTTNGALWLCDNDSPNWGIWMFHMTNGVYDTNDIYGTKVVTTGGDLVEGSSGGCMVDTNLDVFVGQSIPHEDAVYDAMVFTNWNRGVLPPPDVTGSTAFNYVLGISPGEVLWGYGCDVDSVCTNNPGFEANRDMVINSRVNPTMVACPLSIGSDNGTITYITNVTANSTNIISIGSGGGIRVLNATNGSVISITNGAYTQTLTNLDWGQAYTCAAWDNAGNLYGASTSRNLWRVWSPPGKNTNTTVAIGEVLVILPPVRPNITGITLNHGTVIITFSGSSTAAASAFSLQSSGTLKGPYATVAGAIVTGSGGSFSVSTSTQGTSQFYRITQ